MSGREKTKIARGFWCLGSPGYLSRRLFHDFDLIPRKKYKEGSNRMKAHPDNLRKPVPPMVVEADLPGYKEKRIDREQIERSKKTKKNPVRSKTGGTVLWSHLPTTPQP